MKSTHVTEAELIRTMQEKIAAKRAQIEVNKAELRALELEATRERVLTANNDSNEWLSAASRQMVNVAPGMLGDREHFIVTIYDHADAQATGTLTAADLSTLRDYLNLHIWRIQETKK